MNAPELDDRPGEAETGTGISGPTAAITQASLWLSALAGAAAVFVLWLGVAVVWTQETAEGLLATGGFEGTTWGASFVLTLMMFAGGLALSVAARVQALRSGTSIPVIFRPSAMFLWLFLLPAFVLMVCEAFEVDVPDILSTTAAWGSILFVWLILPFALTVGIWRLTVYVSRWVRADSEAARGTRLGAPSLMTALILSMFGADGMDAGCGSEDDSIEAYENLVLDESANVIEASRKTLEHLAIESLAADSNHVVILSKTKMSTCLTSLVTDPRPDGRSEYEWGLAYTLRKLNGDESASLESTHRALEATCAWFANGKVPFGKLGPLFNRILRLRVADRYRELKRDSELVAKLERSSRVGENWTVLDKVIARDQLSECLSSLDEETRKLVELHFIQNRESYAATMKKTHWGYGKARDKVRNARKEISERCEPL